jgi:hypothetical protein
LAHPDSSWSRKRSPKIVISMLIQVNRSMNQKMDATRSQKFMSDSFIDAERIARTRGSR